jgi:hypothetical protein
MDMSDSDTLHFLFVFGQINILTNLHGELEDQALFQARWRHNTWSRSRGVVAKGGRVVKWSGVIFDASIESVVTVGTGGLENNFGM